MAYNIVKGLAILMAGFILFSVTLLFSIGSQPGSPGHLEREIVAEHSCLADDWRASRLLACDLHSQPVLA